jgi:hypothetical protein
MDGGMAEKMGNESPCGRALFEVTMAQTGEPTAQKPLRLWPGVVIVTVQWLVRFGVPMAVPGALEFAVLGGRGWAPD